MDKETDNAKIALGRRLRLLRTMKGWTQQKLGERADVNYKFVGEIERGQQNPSFAILVKLAAALDVALPELFNFEMMNLNRKQIEHGIFDIVKTVSDEDLLKILLVLKTLYPVR